MRPDLSRKIYSQLINGRLVNKNIQNGAILESNALFDEINNQNFDEYKHLYLMIGFELVPIGDAYMIREYDIEDQYKETAKKVQVILDLLSRGIQELSLYPEALTDHTAGVERSHLDKMNDNDDFNNILKACGMTRQLSREIENILVKRAVAYFNAKDKLVLSDGGRAMYSILHDM